MPRDVGGRAVDRFEVDPAVAEVAGRRQAEPARRLGAEVGQDVAVEVHAEDDVHGLGEAHETPCGVVHVEVLELEPAGFADDALGGLLVEPVGPGHEVRFGHGGDLARLALRLPLAGQLDAEAGDALGALRRDHLHADSPLGAEVLHLAFRRVGKVRHDLDEIGQVPLAARVDALAVLAREDVVDALRVGQRPAASASPGRSGSAAARATRSSPSGARRPHES